MSNIFDMFKMFGANPLFGAAGGGGTDAAKQLAMTIAADGASEANVEPADRIAIEQLGRLAELQIADATGLNTSQTGAALTIEAVTRAGWVQQSIAAYEPMIERLTGSLTAGGGLLGPDGDPPGGDSPEDAMFAGIFQMLGPMMLTLASGSMIGHLGRRSLGMYDLPVPRPATDTLLVVLPNLDEFGEDWSLPEDDLRLWVCLNEVCHHAVLGVDHVRDRLTQLLTDHAGAFAPDPSAFEDKLGSLDIMADPSALADLQETLGDPEVVLGAVQSAEQRELLPQLSALVAVIEGYVDYIMDEVGGRLIGSYDMLSEALRRRRVEADSSDRFVEKILGLELTQDQYERGNAFVTGVVERSGPEGLTPLWTDKRALPTPNEVDAPGLWLARIELPNFGDATPEGIEAPPPDEDE